MDKELRNEASRLLQEANIPLNADGKCFEGLRIWIGASSHKHAIIGLADSFGTAFQELGAIVSKSSRGEFGPAGEKQIDDADVILMFTATPGISARALELCVRSRFERASANVNKLHIYMPKSYAGGFIERRFRMYRARYIRFFNQTAFRELDRQLFTTCLYDICNEAENLRRQEAQREREFVPDIAIVTALDLEFKAVLDIVGNFRVDAKRDTEHVYEEYYHGAIESIHGGEHRVVVARAGKGNNKAAVLANSLLHRYPSVRDILVVGVAGGVPDKNAEEHVRLGDIVVCDDAGVIQYDMIKQYTRRKEFTPPPRPPSHDLLVHAEHLRTTMGSEPRYWSYLDDILDKQHIRRPRRAPLKDCPWVKGSKTIRQPTVPGDRSRPRVLSGPIASANTVLKSARVRDDLKTKWKIKAVEMESSGIAEAVWQHGKGYLVVRGICDFANDGKNNVWQPYAAAAAAAYIRAFIETLPVTNGTQ